MLIALSKGGVEVATGKRKGKGKGKPSDSSLIDLRTAVIVLAGMLAALLTILAVSGGNGGLLACVIAGGSTFGAATLWLNTIIRR